MAGLVVKSRARILHGHDWVFSSEVLKVFGDPVDGEVISLKDGKDRLLGSAIYNSKSQIVARRFSRRRQELDREFFERRITQAVDYRRRRGIDLRLCRLVWSESDGLPGVIVDRYGDSLVLQTTTLGMDQRQALLVDALKGNAVLQSFRAYASKVCTESSQELSVLERNDSPVRRTEGLPLRTGILAGDQGAEAELAVHGLRFAVNLFGGQKTGLYLDQLPHYRAVAEHARGGRVLDCFTNQGGFALSCAAAGAEMVIGVESSAEALAAAQANAERNALRVKWVEQDVFDYLRAAEKAGAEFDLIVLDPPSFTKSKGGLHNALRGYRELHLRAFKLLSKDGLLATFSCSHHVSDAAFAQTIADALVDARRSARRVRRFEQALDHPVLPTIPETEYFKGVLLEMMPGR